MRPFVPRRSISLLHFKNRGSATVPATQCFLLVNNEEDQQLVKLELDSIAVCTLGFSSRSLIQIPVLSEGE